RFSAPRCNANSKTCQAPRLSLLLCLITSEKNMSDPLPAPDFGRIHFDISPTDIGSGYAAGITSAGHSLAGAISSVLGGINPQTGLAEEGILDQKKSSEQQLGMMKDMGLIPQDIYEKMMTSNLGAQQKAIGMYTSKFTSDLAMAQQKAQEAAAMSRQQVSESGAMARTQATIKAEADRAAAAQALPAAKKPGLVLPQPPAQQPAPYPGGALPVPNLKLGI